MKIKIAVLALVLAAASFLAISCSSSNKNGEIPGKVMTHPEVSTKVGISSEGMILPEVPEISWSFVPIPEKEGEFKCKLKMKVMYKDARKYLADIELLDLNDFVVTKQQQMLADGSKDVTVDYNIELYIDQQLSKRITKARILLSPL